MAIQRGGPEDDEDLQQSNNTTTAPLEPINLFRGIFNISQRRLTRDFVRDEQTKVLESSEARQLVVQHR